MTTPVRCRIRPNWDKQPFLVERICTCSDGQRDGECHRDGYHAVDGWASQADAEQDARTMVQTVPGVAYRVVVARTGKVVWAGRSGQ